MELSALGRIGISADLNHVIVPEASIPIPDEHNLRCRQSQLTDNFTVQLEHHVHQRMELASHSSTQWGIRLYTSSQTPCKCFTSRQRQLPHVVEITNSNKLHKCYSVHQDMLLLAVSMSICFLNQEAPSSICSLILFALSNNSSSSTKFRFWRDFLSSSTIALAFSFNA